MNDLDPTIAPATEPPGLDALAFSNDGYPGWVRFDATTHELLQDALRVAADWMENDLDCGDCPNRTCTDEDHRHFMGQVHGWRALARHLDLTGTSRHQPPPSPSPSPAEHDLGVYQAGEPALGPVMLEVTTSEPDGLGRLATGQVFGEGRGVFYAITSARRIASQPGTVMVVVTEYRRPDRRVLYRHGVPGQPDVDVLPSCPRCPGRHCQDPSEHYTAIRPLLAAWAHAHRGGDSGDA